MVTLYEQREKCRNIQTEKNPARKRHILLGVGGENDKKGRNLYLLPWSVFRN